MFFKNLQIKEGYLEGNRDKKDLETHNYHENSDPIILEHIYNENSDTWIQISNSDKENVESAENDLLDHNMGEEGRSNMPFISDTWSPYFHGEKNLEDEYKQTLVSVVDLENTVNELSFSVLGRNRMVTWKKDMNNVSGYINKYEIDSGSEPDIEIVENVYRINKLDEQESQTIEIRYEKVRYEITTEACRRILMFVKNMIGGKIRERTDKECREYLRGMIKDLNYNELRYIENKMLKTLYRLCVWKNSKTLFNRLELVMKSHLDKKSLEERMKRHSVARYKDILNIESDECGICYKKYRPVSRCTTLRCLHIFHFNCIRTWMRKSNLCPICRKYY